MICDHFGLAPFGGSNRCRSYWLVTVAPVASRGRFSSTSLSSVTSTGSVSRSSLAPTSEWSSLIFYSRLLFPSLFSSIFSSPIPHRYQDLKSWSRAPIVTILEDQHNTVLHFITLLLTNPVEVFLNRTWAFPETIWTPEPGFPRNYPNSRTYDIISTSGFSWIYNYIYIGFLLNI